MGNNGSTLGYFRYHHGGEGREAAVFYHNFYSQQGCPEKKKKHMFGCKMRRKRGTVNSQFPPLPRVGNCPVSSPFLREPTSNGGRDINGDVTTIFQHLFISAVIIIISC